MKKQGNRPSEVKSESTLLSHLRIALLLAAENSNAATSQATPLAKIEGVACPLGNSQFGLYSAIRNRLTTQSKPDLRYNAYNLLFNLRIYSFYLLLFYTALTSGGHLHRRGRRGQVERGASHRNSHGG